MPERNVILVRAIKRRFRGSIKAAARSIAMDDSYLGRIARGRQQPTEVMARRIARGLGIAIRSVRGSSPPAEPASARMSRRRQENKELLRALAAVHAGKGTDLPRHSDDHPQFEMRARHVP